MLCGGCRSEDKPEEGSSEAFVGLFREAAVQLDATALIDLVAIFKVGSAYKKQCPLEVGTDLSLARDSRSSTRSGSCGGRTEVILSWAQFSVSHVPCQRLSAVTSI